LQLNAGDVHSFDLLQTVNNIEKKEEKIKKNCLNGIIMWKKNWGSIILKCLDCMKN